MSVRSIARKFGPKVLQLNKTGVVETGGANTGFEEFSKLKLSPELFRRTSSLLSNKNWSLVEGKGERFGLRKTFPLPTFRSAFDFMTLIAVECKLTGHHPTWTNTYNKVDIYWTTHDSKGLTLMDIEHAEFCDTQFHHMTIQRKTAERLKEVRKFNATGKMGLRTVGNQPTKTAIAEEAQFGTTVEEPTAGPTSIETLADETRSDELRFAKVFEESEVDKMSSEVALSEETQTDEAKAEESRPEESNEPKPEEPKPEKPKPRSIPSFLF